MAFDLLTFLARALGGFEVSGIEAKVAAWLAEKGAEYPDLKGRADALAVWLSSTIEESLPELDPATMKNTLAGIAADVVHGTAGVDPGSWQGGG